MILSHVTGERPAVKIRRNMGNYLLEERGLIMNLVSELYINYLQKKDDKAIKASPLSIENDNWLAIYENIEKILNGKPVSSLDLDIHLLLNKLI